MSLKIKIAIILAILIILSFFVGLFFYKKSFCIIENVPVKFANVDVVSKISSRVLWVSESAFVKGDEAIVQLESDKYKKELEAISEKTKSAKEELNISNAELETLKNVYEQNKKELLLAQEKAALANEDYSRYQIALKDGIVTKKDLTDAQESLEIVRKNLLNLQNKLSQDELKIKKTTLENIEKKEKFDIYNNELNLVKEKYENINIIAPFNGYINKYLIKKDENIEANSTVAKIIPEQYQLIINLKENEIPENVSKIKVKYKNNKIKAYIASRENNILKLKIRKEYQNYLFLDGQNVTLIYRK